MKHWAVGHAKYAPSSAHRWLVCPASAVLGATIPERKSPEADEGTRVHGLIEKALCGAGFPHGETQEIQDAVALVVSYVDQLGPASVLEFERRVVLVPGQNWGTADILHISADGGVATIADYKNGAMDVQVDLNDQITNYADAVFKEF